MKRIRLTGIVFALGLVACPLVSFAVEHLSFGVYTSNKPTAMVKKFKPVMRAIETHMSRSLGKRVKIRIQVAKNYEQGVNHLATGKVDFSRFGPASYVEAKKTNRDLKILALESKNGSKTFNGVICVAKESPITVVEHLVGKSFAFGNEQSTIGRYLSQQYLENHGIHASDLNRYSYLDRHDKVGTAVGAGNFDAGALNEATFNKLVKKGVPIRAIARFPNVSKPWIARSGLPDKLFSAIQLALLEMRDPNALKALKKDGFLSGSDADYAVIRQAIDNNGAFFQPSPEQQTVDESPSNREGNEDDSTAKFEGADLRASVNRVTS